AYEKLAMVLMHNTTDYPAMDAAYRRSIALEPGESGIQMRYAEFSVLLGREDALPFAQRSAKSNPLSLGSQANLGQVYFYLRRYQEARAAFSGALRAGSNRVVLNWAGINELAAGDPKAAVGYCRDSSWLYDQFCLAIAHHALGDSAQSDAMLQHVLADG